MSDSGDFILGAVLGAILGLALGGIFMGIAEIQEERFWMAALKFVHNNECDVSSLEQYSSDDDDMAEFLAFVIDNDVCARELGDIPLAPDTEQVFSAEDSGHILAHPGDEWYMLCADGFWKIAINGHDSIQPMCIGTGHLQQEGGGGIRYDTNLR